MARRNPRPLDGITVVSLEHAIAAPCCTRQLADLGARVIKVERPGGGDFAREYDTRVRGMASHFVWTNRSKESLALDLKKPDALAVLKQLLAHADVLVQNLAPGAAARLGLGGPGHDQHRDDGDRRAAGMPDHHHARDIERQRREDRDVDRDRKDHGLDGSAPPDRPHRSPSAYGQAWSPSRRR